VGLSDCSDINRLVVSYYGSCCLLVDVDGDSLIFVAFHVEARARVAHSPYGNIGLPSSPTTKKKNQQQPNNDDNDGLVLTRKHCLNTKTETPKAAQDTSVKE